MYLIEDEHILWLAVTKVGSPDAWEPNKDYNLGDIVVPISPEPGQENIAFQCVGFLGKSASSQPVFPIPVGHTVVDKEIEWKSVEPTADPSTLKYDEYFLIEQEVTIS